MIVLHEIGFWHSPDSGRLAADPRRLVRPGWAADERVSLIAYLRAGEQFTFYMGSSYCRFGCGAPRPRLGSRDLSDGVWLWPEGLPHYLELHSIALPDEFLIHARMNGFCIPENALADAKLADEEQLVRSAEKWESWVSANDGVATRGAT